MGIARVRKRDDWSALNFVNGAAAETSRGVATPRAGAQRTVTDEDETDVIVVLNLDSVCRVLSFVGRKP
jgi:hypothetical protein